MLCCACWRCHVLIGSTGVNSEKEPLKRIDRGQSIKKVKRRVHTYIPVPCTSHGIWYCMHERKHIAARRITAQHRAEPQGTARHLFLGGFRYGLPTPGDIHLRGYKRRRNFLWAQLKLDPQHGCGCSSRLGGVSHHVHPAQPVSVLMPHRDERCGH